MMKSELYGPEYWRTQEKVFEAFKNEVMADGCSEEHADAHNKKWRAKNNADVERWKLEYKKFRAEALQMFQKRGMIPHNLETWNALSHWLLQKSNSIGKQPSDSDINEYPTVEMRRDIAFCDEAWHLIKDTEADVLRQFQTDNNVAAQTNLTLRYLSINRLP